MRIGIIGPCEEEIMPLIGGMDRVSVEKHAKLRFHMGQYAGKDIVALFSGVCKVNAAIAAQVLIDRYGVTHMIVTGVAGAMDQKLKIFDTVVSSEAAYHDVANEVLTQYHPWMESIYFKADQGLADGILRANAGDETVIVGRIVTGEAFIVRDGREKIIEKYNPQCVDMETASIAHVCYANAIPFVAIRSISDTSEESGSDSFDKYFKRAAEKSVDVLKKWLSLAMPGI